MNKEEILEKSREQNKNADLHEQEVIAKGGSLGYSIGLIVASLLFMVEMLVSNKPNFAVMAVWMAMEATMFIYKFIKLKRTHELVFAIVFGLITIAFLSIYVITLVGASK